MVFTKLFAKVLPFGELISFIFDNVLNLLIVFAKLRDKNTHNSKLLKLLFAKPICFIVVEYMIILQLDHTLFVLSVKRHYYGPISGQY